MIDKTLRSEFAFSIKSPRHQKVKFHRKDRSGNLYNRMKLPTYQPIYQYIKK